MIDLFIKFFNFINSENGALLSYSHKRLIKTRKYDYNVHSLILTISIELLVNNYFTGTKSVYKKTIRKLISYLENENYPEGFCKRVIGFLKNIENDEKSTLTILKDLIKKKHIQESELKAWQYLRNREVHPKSGSKLINQEYLNKYYKCLSLYYKLVFMIIGYSGDFTEYGLSSFPTKKFNIT